MSQPAASQISVAPTLKGEAAEIAGDEALAAGALSEAVVQWGGALEFYTERSMNAEAARSAAKMAEIEERLGDLDGACVHYGLAADLFKKSGKAYRVPTCLNNQAMLFKAAGEHGEAVRLLELALEEASCCHGLIHTETALLAANLGTVLCECGDLAGAEQRHMQALGIREQLYGASHPDVGLSLGHLGVIHQMRGDAVRARRFYASALSVLNEFSDVYSAERDVFRGNLAAL